MKKILVLIVSIIFSLNVVSASTNTIPRTDADLGVNKNWNITDYNIDNVKRTPRVDASEKIYDFAEIITDEEEKELYEKIQNYINKTNIDMVILTIDEAFSDTEIDEYAVDFYDYNDFGLNTAKYDGIIIVRNVNSFNRYFNIHSFGNAQLYYDYYTLENILDYIYDDIRSDNYLSGFSDFIEESERYYSRGANPNYYVDDNGFIQKNPPKYHLPLFTAVFISGIITLITMIVLVKKNKMIKKEKLATIYVDRNTIKYYNKIDRFLHSHTSSYTVSHNSSSGGGGHSSSHSGSSGGGHSSGGGRHG